MTLFYKERRVTVTHYHVCGRAVKLQQYKLILCHYRIKVLTKWQHSLLMVYAIINVRVESQII